MITRSIFGAGGPNAEGIGLNTVGLHIADNTFTNSSNAHMTDYTRQYDLGFLIAQNNFGTAPGTGDVGGFPSITP